ncbi:hypothetical protein C8R44DRAFT_723838 [Mycena epipterygia]|nr:hypothetical protein C8R44DRAFT_723838 [Mycena epipterygia]
MCSKTIIEKPEEEQKPVFEEDRGGFVVGVGPLPGRQTKRAEGQGWRPKKAACAGRSLGPGLAGGAVADSRGASTLAGGAAPDVVTTSWRVSEVYVSPTWLRRPAGVAVIVRRVHIPFPAAWEEPATMVVRNKGPQASHLIISLNKVMSLESNL